jgi:hypothetical protein
LLSTGEVPLPERLRLEECSPGQQSCSCCSGSRPPEAKNTPPENKWKVVKMAVAITASRDSHSPRTHLSASLPPGASTESQWVKKAEQAEVIGRPRNKGRGSPSPGRRLVGSGRERESERGGRERRGVPCFFRDKVWEGGNCAGWWSEMRRFPPLSPKLLPVVVSLPPRPSSPLARCCPSPPPSLPLPYG